MFVIDPRGDTETAFWAPVNLRLPGGAVHKIQVEFAELTDDEIDQVYADGGLDEDLIKRVVVNWSGIAQKGEDGKQEKVEFNADTLAYLCKRRWFRQAVINTYVDHMSGRGAVKRAERQRKNS